MTGTNSRTVEAWIYNPQVADEETIFSWGRCGGSDGGQWTHVAYTFDNASATVAVYRDGQLANSGVRTNINTYATNTLGNPLSFRLGAQNEGNGSVTPGLMGSMTIVRLRVYDEALPGTGDNSIQSHFLAEAPSYQPPRLSIQVDSTAGTATITWAAALGRTYTVQSSGDLQSWTTRVNGLTSGTYTDDSTASARFYRVQVE